MWWILQCIGYCSTVAIVVLAEAYGNPAQEWASIETTSLVVGAGVGLLCVLVYVITNAPFPLFLFGGYLGSTFGISFMLLAFPDIGAPCMLHRTDTRVVVVGLVVVVVRLID
jgi:hypothetical protein